MYEVNRPSSVISAGSCPCDIVFPTTLSYMYEVNHPSWEKRAIWRELISGPNPLVATNSSLCFLNNCRTQLNVCRDCILSLKTGPVIVPCQMPPLD